MGLYESIKEKAKEKGISINKLEQELGFGRSSIAKFDKNVPSVAKLQKVADTLGTTVTELYTVDVSGSMPNESYALTHLMEIAQKLPEKDIDLLCDMADRMCSPKAEEKEREA